MQRPSFLYLVLAHHAIFLIRQFGLPSCSTVLFRHHREGSEQRRVGNLILLQILVEAISNSFAQYFRRLFPLHLRLIGQVYSSHRQGALMCTSNPIGSCIIMTWIQITALKSSIDAISGQMMMTNRNTNLLLAFRAQCQMCFLTFCFGCRLSESQRWFIICHFMHFGIGIWAELFSVIKIQLAFRSVLEFNGFVLLLH